MAEAVGRCAIRRSRPPRLREDLASRETRRSVTARRSRRIPVRSPARPWLPRFPGGSRLPNRGLGAALTSPNLSIRAAAGFPLRRGWKRRPVPPALATPGSHSFSRVIESFRDVDEAASREVKLIRWRRGGDGGAGEGRPPIGVVSVGSDWSRSGGSGDMTTQFPAHSAGTSPQIERSAVFGDPDQVDPPMTEDLLESSRSDPGSGQNPSAGLTTGLRCGPGVDHHRHIHRDRLF
jgi:hypothetical protein